MEFSLKSYVILAEITTRDIKFLLPTDYTKPKTEIRNNDETSMHLLKFKANSKPKLCHKKRSCGLQRRSRERLGKTFDNSILLVELVVSTPFGSEKVEIRVFVCRFGTFLVGD
jgi:hypothetical protein